MFRTLGIVKGALLTNRQRLHLSRRLDGKSVLEWVVRQVTDCELLSGVVVLADEGVEGDDVRELAPIDVPVFSCDAQDTVTLLGRALERFPLESFVFIGADWPFIDPTLIDQLVRAADLEPHCDYAAYQFTNEIFSPGRPYGLFPEWYRSETIRSLAEKNLDPVHRQLPGSYFLDNQKQYTVELLPVPAGLDQQENIRSTFADEADWDVILDIHDALELDALDCHRVGSLLGARAQELVH